MKFGSKVAILLAIVGLGVGIAVYYHYIESQKKPEFNVFDLKIETNVAYVYVQNMGTADTHDVMIQLMGRKTPEPYAYNNLSVNGSRLEILRVGQIAKVKINLDNYWALNGIIDYLVIVRSAKGIQNEFYFKK